MAPAVSTTRSRAAHPARDLCLAPGRSIDAPVVLGGRYGRMFPDLPSASFDEDRLLALGVDGGICDGGACDVDSQIEAGQPFFGQYLAHDITADRSPLRAHADINTLRNVRSPRANLEVLYGGGPVGSPYLFDQRDPAKLLLGSRDCDLPRNQQGIALIGDPRNDVHAFMTGLQVAFIRDHNRLVDRLRADGVAESDLFEHARLALNWHYQWVILHDFLPNLVGDQMTASVINHGPRFYRPQASRTSRSNSRMPPTATAIRKSKVTIRSRRAVRYSRCFPTSPGSASLLPSTSSTGACSSMSRLTLRRSEPSRLTAPCRYR